MKRIETQIDIEAPAQLVWRHLTDFPSHAGWNPLFASVEGIAEEGQTITIRAREKDKKGMVFTPTVLVCEPSLCLRWQGKLWVRGLFDGTHEYVLTDLGNGVTRLDHREAFRGLLVPLLGRVLAETTRKFVAFNEALKQRVEQDFQRQGTHEEHEHGGSQAANA